jgi:hypothetical protein
MEVWERKSVKGRAAKSISTNNTNIINSHRSQEEETYGHVPVAIIGQRQRLTSPRLFPNNVDGRLSYPEDHTQSDIYI